MLNTDKFDFKDCKFRGRLHVRAPRLRLEAAPISTAQVSNEEMHNYNGFDWEYKESLKGGPQAV